jgi:translation initiation factor 2 subunit 2
METYEELLEQAYQEVKPLEKSERFEVPKVEGHIEGNKTIITNLPQIASFLRRNQDHILKYLLRELATPGAIKQNRVILQRKISSIKMNEKLADYVTEFVLCKECKKPDTELVKEKDFLFIHCLACGAKHSVRSKI